MTRIARRAGLAATLAALAAAAPGCGAEVEKTADAETTIRPVSITVADLNRRPVVRTVDAIGTLRGWDEVTVGAKKAGRVIKVFHDFGDEVKPGEKLVELMHWWEDYTHKHGAEINANPSPGNKAGGLTTIIEKSLGAMAKAGSTNLVEVVRYADAVTKNGFVFMDTPGFDPVAATGQVAGGANVFADVKVQAVQASTEQILATRPDVILEIRAANSAFPSGDRAAELSVWKALSAVPAVRNNRVLFIFDDRLVIPGPRLVEGTAEMARALHPDAFRANEAERATRERSVRQ